MTQLFDEQRNAVPVTAVRVGTWYVTQVKTPDNDGYAALQLGLLRERYRKQEFDASWLARKKQFFLELREAKVAAEDLGSFELGKPVGLENSSVVEGDIVHVTGTSRGLGFQGVVKRHGFGGGPKSHGSRFHRRPGAVGHRRTHGEVDKGKKLPGHTGARRVTVKNLRVVKVDADAGVLFVQGAVPGKSRFLVAVSKKGS
jgi:large subunit ribosomal protein L3